jgi:phosphoenolpyruvate synthase/pyruvate phosphate dikinase
MDNEELETVKKQLAAMKKIELTGFINTATATVYFQEKEAILEGIVKIFGRLRNRKGLK